MYKVGSGVCNRAGRNSLKIDWFMPDSIVKLVTGTKSRQWPDLCSTVKLVRMSRMPGAFNWL